MNNHGLFSAKVLDILEVATDTKHFSFEILNADVSFSAGQFFLLSVSEKISRAYSIASAPSLLPRFDLLIKRVPNGAATEKFLWKKKIGDVLSFRGPMGRFLIDDPTKKQILIATGTGLAPMRAFWQELLSQKNPPEVHLFFGVRSEEFLFCQKELLDLQKKNKNFSATICLSRPAQKNDFFCGRVTDAISKKEKNFFSKAEISLCGSREMINDAKKILEEKKFSGKINIESW